ncbi:reverse transcriptase domain-containing protein [Tanacetum coccineum]
MVPATAPLIGFSGEIIWSLGANIATGGILTLKSSKIIPIECAAVSGPDGQPPAAHQVIEERIKVNKLCDLLQRNLGVFAWKPADITGIPRHIAKYRLNIREGCLPIRQKKRRQSADKNQAIQEEVEKFVDAGIMKEVHYHNWLSNPVMVKKHDGSWRMCVDFKDLNKACPKDGYPLPKIDWKVESLCGFPFKCFLDAYKGYHQIKMAKEDEEKIEFITSQGIFCYSKMPFGLRNAGATYQHLVDKAFHKQIGRNLKVYVDDLVIKSCMEDEIIRDIEETFKTLREINMKLNPKKYTFGVEEGMFLGYKVNTKGIKVCPDKADAVLSLPSSKCLKDVQKLNGKLASLNRFLAKSAEKSLPFFKTLKKCTKKTPEEKEELIVYLSAAKEAGQILADFIVERPEEDSLYTPMEVNEELLEPWILFMDGSSCADGFGVGLILTNLEGAEFTYALRFRFKETNNEAEYEALIAGLRIAEEMGVRNLLANVDSRLVANQVSETYTAKEAYMIRYLEKVRALANGFKMFLIKQVPRSANKKANEQSKIASTSFVHLSKQVLVEALEEKSINKVEVLEVVEEEGNTWMNPIYEYLTEGTLPAEENKARAVQRKSQQFAMINGLLYKIISRTMATPTIHKDARALIRACQDCQVHRPIPRNPQQKLTLITSPWPFYKWGLEIARPFSKGPGKVKFLIVAIDYFIKLCIHQRFAFVKHPQANRLVERENRSLGEGIKARLDARNKNWMEEISHVLWAHPIMIKSSNDDTPFSLTYGTSSRVLLGPYPIMINHSNDDTPFSLTYGTEAVIPAEIGMHMLRTVEVDMVHNDEALEINLDLLKERREQAAIRKAKSKEKMEKHYNSKVRSTSFKPGDLVYHGNDASRTEGV